MPAAAAADPAPAKAPPATMLAFAPAFRHEPLQVKTPPPMMMEKAVLKALASTQAPAKPPPDYVKARGAAAEKK